MCVAYSMKMSALDVRMSTLAVCVTLPSPMTVRPPANVVRMAEIFIHDRKVRSLANQTRASIRRGASTVVIPVTHLPLPPFLVG